MVEPQPSIELFGLIFHTPVTALTDVAVAIICYEAYRRLCRMGHGAEVHRLFQFYFLTMSLATLLGGVIGHALMHYLPFYMKLPGWITSMFSVALLERAVIQYARKYLSRNVGTFFSWLNILELLTFMILSFVTLNFQYVLIHAAYGIAIVVGGFSVFIYLNERSVGSKYMLMGVEACIIGASFFQFQIGLDKWFNHVDISHVFMMLASVLFFRGSKYLIRANEGQDL